MCAWKILAEQRCSPVAYPCFSQPLNHPKNDCQWVVNSCNDMGNFNFDISMFEMD